MKLFRYGIACVGLSLVAACAAPSARQSEPAACEVTTVEAALEKCSLKVPSPEPKRSEAFWRFRQDRP